MWCEEARELLEHLISSEAEGCDCSLLSGGVDTSVIVALHPRRERLRAITVDLGGEDARFAALAAKLLGLGEHLVIKPSIEEYLEAVDWVLVNFKTIDPIEVSCDVVHYLSLRAAKASGCSCVLSGDGGDELFVGYTFLFKRAPEEVLEWVRERAESSRLPTVEVGERLDIEVRTPLYTEGTKRVALGLPVHCLTDGRQGKLVLREVLRRRGLEELARRPKAPVNVGSGSMEVLKSLVAGASGEGLDFAPPSRAHAWLARRLSSLTELPPRTGECPVCGRAVRRNYCTFCGAYVKGGRVLLHYSD
ncbi:MAG: asparagine synthase-related protein [Acidilobaceae archaeon]|nr:asparagine synthase-related protein [Acidilobaceae archaeon]